MSVVYYEKYEEGGLIKYRQVEIDHNPDAVLTKQSRLTATLLGNGSQTEFTVTHDWGTRRVAAIVVAVSAPYNDVYPDIERPTINSILIRIEPALAVGQDYEVLINSFK